MLLGLWAYGKPFARRHKQLKEWGATGATIVIVELNMGPNFRTSLRHTCSHTPTWLRNNRPRSKHQLTALMMQS